MKKRILSILLALLMGLGCIAALASCRNNPRDVALAEKVIRALNLNYGPNSSAVTMHSSDYQISAKQVVDGIAYAVSWSASSDDPNYANNVKVGETDAGGMVTISITQASVKISYTLKASVKVGSVKKSIEFNRFIAPAALGGGDAHVHQPAVFTHVSGTFTHRAECTAEDCPDGYVTEDCTPVLNQCSVCGNEYSVEQILTACQALVPDSSLKGSYELSGLVTAVIADLQIHLLVNGVDIIVEANTDGLTVAAGDVVTVQGTLSKRLSGQLHLDGEVVKVGGGHTDPDEGDGFTPITAPVDGTYYFAMNINGTWFYITGELDGYFFSTSANQDEATTVELVADDDGWLIKESGRFIEVEADGVTLKFNTKPTSGKHWTWDPTHQIFVWTNGSDAYFLGAYGSYTTLRAINMSELDGSSASNQYPAKLGTFPADKP